MQGLIIKKSDGAWHTGTHAGTVVLHKGYIPRLKVLRLQQKESCFELQEINTENILLYFCKGDTVKSVTATLTIQEACAVMFLVLSGTVHHSIPPIAERVLCTGQYTVFYSGVQDIRICMEGPSPTVTLAIFIPATIALAQVTMYPGLSRFTTKMRQQTTCYLTDDVLYMHAGIYDIVTRILIAPYNKKLHPLYETLCSELLREMFTSSLHYDRQNNFRQAAWMHSIYTIKAFIDQHIDLHYTIDQLARKAGVNERQLKTGFKALFGSGVYTYLKTQRMKAAYGALEQTTATIKYIAGKCGYRNVYSFSRAFKTYFGRSPGDVRRKQ